MYVNLKKVRMMLIMLKLGEDWSPIDHRRNQE